MNLLGRCVAALLLALAMAAAVASPVTIDQTTEAETNPEPALAASAPGGLRAWIRSEATGTFLQQQIEQDRLAVASEPYTPPAPTWIQGAANVNPADYPTLDRSVETAERDLRTIEWVLQERERLARQAHDGSATEPAGPNWIRALMPSNWLPVLKAYRDRLNAYCGKMREFCVRRGITHVLVDTQTDLDELLLDYLRKRGLLR